MDSGAQPRPDGDGPQWRWARLAAWCQLVGVILALATLICCLLGDVSPQQALALGLPALVLIVGSLFLGVASDPEAGRRFGFHVGLYAGSVLRLWRYVFRGRGKGALAIRPTLPSAPHDFVVPKVPPRRHR